jgi:hypothetical protein
MSVRQGSYFSVVRYIAVALLPKFHTLLVTLMSGSYMWSITNREVSFVRSALRSLSKFAMPVSFHPR